MLKFEDYPYIEMPKEEIDRLRKYQRENEIRERAEKLTMLKFEEIRDLMSRSKITLINEDLERVIELSDDERDNFLKVIDEEILVLRSFKSNISW